MRGCSGWSRASPPGLPVLRGGGAGEAQQCDPDGFQMWGRQTAGLGKGESCFELSRGWKVVMEKHTRLCRGHKEHSGEALVTGESPLNAPCACVENVALSLCPPAPTKNEMQMEMLIYRGLDCQKCMTLALFIRDHMAQLPPPRRWECSFLQMSLSRRSDVDMLPQEAAQGSHCFLSIFWCHFEAISSSPQREAGTLVSSCSQKQQSEHPAAMLGSSPGELGMPHGSECQL